MEPLKTPVLQVVFLIPPKAHMLDVTGPATIFYETGCAGVPLQLAFSTIFANETESESSSMLSFSKLTPYDQLTLNKGDLVFIPGLEYSLLLDEKFLNSLLAFQNWLKIQHRNGVILCSVCTGAFLLAASGLLDGRECTTHWRYAERFKKLYPNAKLQTNRLFIKEDQIYTSAGITSGIDLALYIVEELWGAHLAATVAKEAVVYFRRAIGDPQLSVFTQYRNHIDHRIHKVQDHLIQSLSHRFSIDELAGKVNMSTRNLTRLFKKTTNITIGGYLNQLRAEHAEKLIAEGHTLQAAALHCGLKSTNQLRHLLNEHHLTKSGSQMSQ